MIRPQAQMIHHGPGIPADPLRQRICDWLTANGINPSRVKPEPIYVLTIPHPNSTINGGQPHLIDVIVFTQYYDADGRREMNLLTKDAVTFQRTVPLQVPFPTDPTTDGEADGEGQEVEPVEEGQRSPEHEGGPEADEQQAVRPAEAEEVQDRRPGPREERTGEGVAARITVAEEGRTKGRRSEVPKPEEEEVAE